MKSVFTPQQDCKDGESVFRSDTVPGFQNIAKRFVQQLRKDLDANEVRALVANKVASPVLQVCRNPAALFEAYLPLDADRNRS